MNFKEFESFRNDRKDFEEFLRSGGFGDGSYYDEFGSKKERSPPRNRKICGELVECPDGVYRLREGSEEEPF